MLSRLNNFMKKFNVLLFFGIFLTIIFISFNFYNPEEEVYLSVEIICPNSLNYEKELVVNINAITKNEYIEAITLGLLQDNISVDQINLKRSIYKFDEIFFEDILFKINKNEISKDKKVTISINVRDKYGFESKKYCVYKSFELTNKPNE